jgi:hypothetical protein
MNRNKKKWPGTGKNESEGKKMIRTKKTGSLSENCLSVKIIKLNCLFT